MKKFGFGVVAIVILVGLGSYILREQKSDSSIVENSKPLGSGVIRYIPIGDSYTIGLGVKEEDRWPEVMVRKLKAQGINIEITKNPAVSGYTVRDAIEIELPVVEREKPDLVTVFIGANDSFRLTDKVNFQNDLRELLDKLQKSMVYPQRIVLVTLPDYTRAASSKNISSTDKKYIDNINGFNQIIKNEAEKRGLKVADIYPSSLQMVEDKYYISDGLHPSALGYLEWEKVITPVARELIKP